MQPLQRCRPGQADSIIGTNEALTNSSATPKPQASIPAQQSSTFTVAGPLSPDITTAVVRYSIGGKSCVFRTTFINTIVPGGLGSGSLNKCLTRTIRSAGNKPAWQPSTSTAKAPIRSRAFLSSN